DPVVFREFGGVALRIGPQNVGEQRPQHLVVLEFGLDLSEKRFGNRSGVRKNSDRDFGIVQYVLNGEAERDQRTLSMLTGPQIEIAIWSRLHLAAPREIPIAVEISSPEYINEEKEQI